MRMRTTDPARAALYAVVLVAAIASFAVAEGRTIVSGVSVFTPRMVFGVLATLIVVTVALGRLFGSYQSVQEGWTPTHVALAGVWTLYLLAGIGLVLVGYTGWVVLANLLVAIGAGLAFWYLYDKQ
jgi:hypothetical protein